MSGDILDSIDGALFDFEVSKDAMRWSPPEEQPPRIVGPGGQAYVINSGELRRIGTAGRIEIQIDTRSFNEQMAEVGRQLNRFGQQMGDALNTMFEPLRKFSATLAKRAHMREPGSHGHCRTCHPEQAPRPLAVNGHEYRRRQRARQRRKRG